MQEAINHFSFIPCIACEWGGVSERKVHLPRFMWLIIFLNEKSIIEQVHDRMVFKTVSSPLLDAPQTACKSSL